MDRDNIDHGKGKMITGESSRQEPKPENSATQQLISVPIQIERQSRRFTHEQTNRMEAYRRLVSNYPNDYQRSNLARELGLPPNRVLYWFQNRRQTLRQLAEHDEGVNLRMENEQLRVANSHLQETVNQIKCNVCLVKLDHENARMRNQVHAMIEMAKHNIALHASGMLASTSNGEPLTMDDLYNDIFKSCKLDVGIITYLASSGIEELQVMATIKEPSMWLQSGPDGSSSTLNLERYFQVYKQKYPYWGTSEASRATVSVNMDQDTLVHILMDAERWSNFFPDIISRATVLDVMTPGVNYEGALYVMRAELHVQSPFVPTRQIYFLRYCKHYFTDTWIVMDVSLEDLPLSELTKCRKRPSGCLIKDIQNGQSEVTWLEHFELDQNAHKSMYQSILVDSMSFLFGAKRWCSTLARRCQRQECLPISSSLPPEVMIDVERKRNLLKLSDRMVNDFYSGVTASSSPKWRIIPGSSSYGPDKCIHFMTRVNASEPGTPIGVLLMAVSSFRLGASPQDVVNFLQDMTIRSEWDIFAVGYTLEETERIVTSSDQQSYICLMGLHNENIGQSDTMILQENHSDDAGALVVYCLVAGMALQQALNVGNQECVRLQSSGFSILNDQYGGSLVTYAFQYMQTITSANPLDSIEHVTDNIDKIIKKMKIIFGSPTLN